MNKMKKLLSFALALTLVLGMIPTQALANETTPATTQPTEASIPETTVPETTVPQETEGDSLIDKLVDGAKNLLSGGATENTDPTGNTENTEATGNTEATENTETTAATTAPTTAPTQPSTEATTAPTEAVTEPTTETTEATEETLGTGDDVANEAILCEHCEATLDEDGNVVHEDDCPSLCICEPKRKKGEVHNEECPLYEVIEEVTKEVTPDGITIQVFGKIPEEVSLSAESVEVQQRATFNLRRNAPTLLFAYDITLSDAEGNEWQPAQNETVTVSLEVLTKGLADGNPITIVHEHGDETKELGEYVVTDGKLTFETDGFSTFYFYITYEFGGYSYTMDGNGEVYLSKLLNALNIGYSVSDVSSVKFSNPAYIEITKKGSDWLLTSLTSFGSEETLTIIFNDGEVYEIAVKDPVVYNYAVGNDITNVTKLATKTHTVAEVNNGDTAAKGQTYTVNSAQISVDNVKTAGVAEKTAGTHPAPDATHMIIYAEEGMAIDFIGGTDWTYAGSKPTYAGSEIWFWAWESAKSANYVIVKDGSAGKQAKFTVTTTVDSKKYYCNVVLCVVENSSPTKLAGNLPAGYSIKNVPVTLYNYDGKAFNAVYDGNGQNYFAFSGSSKGVDATKTNAGWGTSGVQANGGGGVALMGIVENELVDGLPVMSQGQKVDVFSTKAVNGKTVYSDVNFQFIYNDSTGYYNYNAALNHAQYNSSNNTIELYKQSLAPSDTPNGTSHGNAGFYPFEDIYKAYTNTGYTQLSDAEWAAKLENNAFELIPSQYSSDIALTNATAPASTVDLHYGIQVASDFYLPKGKQLNGHDMVYEFTGDDDLWVFIDGKLVLDIGGGHTYVSGSFNLTTGEVWVEKYTQLAAADGGSYTERKQGTDLRYTDQFLKGLQDDQMHTIHIFYLERHAGVSNCRMRFNLPLVPEGAVLVSKDLVNDDENAEGRKSYAVPVDEEFEFIVYTAADKDDDGDATDYKPLTNTAYSIVGSTATGTTDANGVFKLKDGQTAQFTGIDRYTNVKVMEKKPKSDLIYKQSQISVGGGTAEDYTFDTYSDMLIMPLDGSLTYAFTNTIDVSDLSITKTLTNNDNAPVSGAVYTIAVKIQGEPYTGTIKVGENTVTADENGQFTIKADETALIENIPSGYSYEVTEVGVLTDDVYVPTGVTVPGGYAFQNVQYENNVSGEGGLIANTTVMVKNTIVAVSGHLTINKTGINLLDHHLRESGTDNREVQSTIYHITGTSAAGETVDLTVVIPGNEAVTIRDIPVGTYTVTEKEDWSWRYDATEADKQAVIVGGDEPVVVNFANNRSQKYWLSGDSFAENWWGDNTVTRLPVKGLDTTN